MQSDDSVEETGSFTDLENDINSCQGNTLELTRDYSYNEGTPKQNTFGIFIKRNNFTIDGKGHTLNGENLVPIFTFFDDNMDNLTLKNIIFKNGNGTRGTLDIERNTVYVYNCTFINNTHAVFDYGKGVVIENSFFINNTGGNGGAIYSNFGKITNSTFINNTAKWAGGAIHPTAEVTIDSCTFINNTAGNNGGAIYTGEWDKLHLSNSVFINNSAGKLGGAVYVYHYSDISNCEFIGNYINGAEGSYNWGGALSLGSYSKLKDSTFINNSAYKGGGVYVSKNSTIDGCTFTNNTGSLGGATYIEYNGVVKNSKYTGNTATTGGAVWIKEGEISNTEFKDNNATEEGGAISVTNSITLNRVTFNNNTANNTENNIASKNNDTNITFVKDSIITANAASYIINYGGIYSVVLKDSEGKAIANEKVTFTLNGKVIGTQTTNANGVATITLTANILKTAKYGSKNLVISFNGNDNCNPVSKTVKININKEAVKITAKKKTFKKSVKTKKYTVTLKNSKGKVIKKAKLTLKIKGKTYKATTNSKGKATFKIKKLSKKGKHTATITYKTTANYLKATKKIKITIK